MADTQQTTNKLSQLSQNSGKKEKETRYDLSGGKPTLKRKKKAIDLLDDSFFNVSWMCKQIGIQRRSYQRWRKSDPEFDRACSEIWESVIDNAEVHLQKNIANDKEASLIFFLKTRAKDRGYVEKQEIEHSGESVKINVIIPDDVKKLFEEQTKDAQT
jgi:hypothetical protein